MAISAFFCSSIDSSDDAGFAISAGSTVVLGSQFADVWIAAGSAAAVVGTAVGAAVEAAVGAVAAVVGTAVGAAVGAVAAD